MVLTWVITLPGAALVAAGAMGIERGLGTRWGSAINLGLLVVYLLLLAGGLILFTLGFELEALVLGSRWVARRSASDSC